MEANLECFNSDKEYKTVYCTDAEVVIILGLFLFFVILAVDRYT